MAAHSKNLYYYQRNYNAHTNAHIYTTGQKASGLITHETNIAGPDRSGLKDKILPSELEKCYKEPCTRPVKNCWLKKV
jgi:hypothetical protein